MHRSNRLMDIMDCRLEAMGPDGQFGAWPKRAWSGATEDDDEGRVPVFRDCDFRRRSKRRGKQGGMRAKRSPSAGLLGVLVAEWDEAKKTRLRWCQDVGPSTRTSRRPEVDIAASATSGRRATKQQSHRKLPYIGLACLGFSIPPLQPVMDNGGDGRIAKPGYTEEF